MIIVQYCDGGPTVASRARVGWQWQPKMGYDFGTGSKGEIVDIWWIKEPSHVSNNKQLALAFNVSITAYMEQTMQANWTFVILAINCNIW